jgi:putative peptide zinc metalloprotease protein
VLVVGQANVVAPQNISAAVSSNCLRCVTQALAVQLVVTVPPDFTPQAKARLQQLWAQIMFFSRHMKGMSFDEIQSRIADYEKQIVTIVKPELPPLTSTSTSDSPTPSPSTSLTPGLAGTYPSATPSDVTSAGAAESGTPTDSASSSDSATPSQSSSESPSSSSSPSASDSQSASPSSSDTPSGSPSESPSDSPSPSPS